MSCFITLDTKKINNITTSSLDTGGFNILSTAPVIEKGVVFSFIDITPTVGGKNSIKQTVYGKGIYKFNTTISGLTSGFTYYIRAYAISSTGDIGYGDVLEAKISPNSSINCSLSVSLDSGKIYSIPSGYTIVGATDVSSLSSKCIDVSKINTTVLRCYGATLMIGGADNITAGHGDHSNGRFFTHTGIIINGKEYVYPAPFAIQYGTGPGVPWGNSGDANLTGGGDVSTLKNQIYSFKDLSSIIYNLRACQYADDGYTQGRGYMYQFHANALDEKISFMKGYFSRDGNISSTPMITYIPIRMRSEITEITNCPCT